MERRQFIIPTAPRSKHRTLEYQIWQGMIQRCENPNHISYKNYGARGVTVCLRWRNSFDAFLTDMGPKPPGDTSLHRIDNHPTYEPGHVIWTTRTEQNRNRSNNSIFTFDGVSRTIAEWASIVQVPISTVIDRRRTGWTDAQALELEWPPQRGINKPSRFGQHDNQHAGRAPSIFVVYQGQRMSLHELSEACGINYGVLKRRHSLGWSVDRMASREVSAYKGNQIEYNGKLTNLAALAHEAGLDRHTVYNRVKAGMSIEDALSVQDARVAKYSNKQRLMVIYKGAQVTLWDACRAKDVRYATVIQRRHKYNLTPQEAFDAY